MLIGWYQTISENIIQGTLLVLPELQPWWIWVNKTHGPMGIDDVAQQNQKPGTGSSLGMHPANRRRHCNVTTSLIGWALT